MIYREKYTAALEALDTLPQVDLDPQTVLADYELAIRNSVSSMLPSTRSLDRLLGELFSYSVP